MYLFVSLPIVKYIPIKPPKNHRQVYSEYQLTDQYKCNNISYGAFYMYAREYWLDIEWDKTIGEIIDD